MDFYKAWLPTKDEKETIPSLKAQTPSSGERGYSPQSVGHLFGVFGLLAMLLVLLVAAWFGQVLVVILAGLVLSAAGIAKLWSRFSLVGVRCERFLSEQRLFPGEHIELRLRLVNRKLLPLPWVQVDDEIPAGWAAGTATRPGSRPGFDFLSYAGSLLWYTGISWRHRLQVSKRGYYSLGPVMVTSGDIFGFYPRSVPQPLIDHVIVYPRIFQLAQLGLPSLYPLGETKAERRIFADPTRTIGVRDYSPHDSLRYIHWKASARHQKLQVKVFEPTTTLKVALFLAVDSFQQNEGVNAEPDFELGISTVASIANYVVQQRSPVGLYVNACLSGSGQPVRIPPGSGVTQLVNILESLAKITLLPSGSFDQFLESEWSSLPWGTTLIIVISKPLDSLSGLLTRLREAGYKLLVLQVGEWPGGSVSQVAWYYVKRPGNLIEFASRETQ